MKHKYVQSNKACESSWAFLCSPVRNNSKTKDHNFKRENGAYLWRLVTCPTCKKLKEFAHTNGTFIGHVLNTVLK